MPFAPTLGGQWHSDSASSHTIKSSLNNLECNIPISNQLAYMNKKKAYNSDCLAPRMNLSRVIFHACVAYIIDEADETTDSSFALTKIHAM
jgi:hypothetical protein